MITNKVFNKVKEHQSFPSVSIYIPTLITGDYEVNRIRWKNELSNVFDKLENSDYDKRSFLKPAEDLIEDNDFWANQSAGLAGFFTESFFELVHLNRSVPKMNHLDDRFIINPLITAKSSKQQLYLLTLSQNKIELYEAVNDGIYPICTDDILPKNMDEALNLDIQPETLHGKSEGLNSTNNYRDKDNIRLHQFFRVVDEGLWTLLEGEETPLVLACVDEYHGIFKAESRYNHISDHFLSGNPDRLKPGELSAQLRPIFDANRNEENENFISKIGAYRAENRFTEILNDVSYNTEIGNVQTILLPQDYLTNNESKIVQIENLLRTAQMQDVEIISNTATDHIGAITRNPVIANMYKEMLNAEMQPA